MIVLSHYDRIWSLINKIRRFPWLSVSYCCTWIECVACTWWYRCKVVIKWKRSGTENQYWNFFTFFHFVFCSCFDCCRYLAAEICLINYYLHGDISLCNVFVKRWTVLSLHMPLWCCVDLTKHLTCLFLFTVLLLTILHAWQIQCGPSLRMKKTTIGGTGVPESSSLTKCGDAV